MLFVIKPELIKEQPVPTPEFLVEEFFQDLNNRNFESAYDKTINPLWSPLSKFLVKGQSDNW